MTIQTNTARRSIHVADTHIVQHVDGSVSVENRRTGATATTFHDPGQESDNAYSDAVDMARMDQLDR